MSPKGGDVTLIRDSSYFNIGSNELTLKGNGECRIRTIFLVGTGYAVSATKNVRAPK